MKISFKKGILLVILGGDINTNNVRELDPLFDLISNNGFSNVLIDINARLDDSGIKKINELKTFSNVLFT